MQKSVEQRSFDSANFPDDLQSRNWRISGEYCTTERSQRDVLTKWRDHHTAASDRNLHREEAKPHRLDDWGNPPYELIAIRNGFRSQFGHFYWLLKLSNSQRLGRHAPFQIRVGAISKTCHAETETFICPEFLASSTSLPLSFTSKVHQFPFLILTSSKSYVHQLLLRASMLPHADDGEISPERRKGRQPTPFIHLKI
jgi:hypothetical protein